MDGTQAEVVKKITIHEKEKVIERYEKVLSVLKGVKINEFDLVHIKKPLDELESYLKHIPNGPLFNDILPTEIKLRILNLSFPCDTQAFIGASVCQQWKRVLESRFEDQKKIVYCENSELVNPAELMKAATALKLDVHLVIGKPVTEVEPKLVTDALTNVSKFTVTNQFDFNLGDEILSDEQFEHLFAGIEKGDKVMEEVELIRVNLTGINQERLANCLVKKMKRLTLKAGYSCIPVEHRMLDVETFMSKLLQDSANVKLSHLTLSNIDLGHYDEKSFTNVANALCKVENVKLCGRGQIVREITERLIKNIIQTPIVMKSLIIDPLNEPDLRDVINPQDLKNVFIKVTTLRLEGAFTEEQLDAVKNLPDVDVDFVMEFIGLTVFVIKKGSSEML